jgi:hypothetical protein
VQIANPNLIVEKKALKKWMHWHPKAPLKEIFKYNDLTVSGVSVAFSLRCPPATELYCATTHLDKVIERPGGALGFLPFLCHHLDPLLRVAFGHFVQENSNRIWRTWRERGR